MIDGGWYQRPPDLPERVAAGGIVARLEDDRPVIALVRERDLPDFVLPKGGVEPGESLEQAARREIAEEAGLTELRLVSKLGVRERQTYGKERWAVIHYFLFTTAQADGAPTEVDAYDHPQWFALDALPAFLWPEQRALVETHRRLIQQAVCGKA